VSIPIFTEQFVQGLTNLRKEKCVFLCLKETLMLTNQGCINLFASYLSDLLCEHQLARALRSANQGGGLLSYLVRAVIMFLPIFWNSHHVWTGGRLLENLLCVSIRLELLVSLRKPVIPIQLVPMEGGL